MNDLPNYYEQLGVEPDAGPDLLKLAYRRRAVEFHPDRNYGDVEAAERFKAAAEAYAVLSDPYLRTRYNCLLAGDVAAADDDERARERERAFECNRELHVELNRLEMLAELYDESVRGAIRVEVLTLAATAITAGLAGYLSSLAAAWPDGSSHPASWLVAAAWIAPILTGTILVAALVRHRSVARSRSLVRASRRRLASSRERDASDPFRIVEPAPQSPRVRTTGLPAEGGGEGLLTPRLSDRGVPGVPEVAARHVR